MPITKLSLIVNGCHTTQQRERAEKQMSKSLRIRMSVPLPSNGIVNVPHFTFSHWLPLHEDDSITVSEGDMTLTLSFDMDCLGHVSDIKEGDLPNHVNVLVDQVRAEVTVSNLTDELADFIVRTDYYRRGPERLNPHERRLIDEYGALGERVDRFTIGRVNRLISYARAQKGQYWLEEYAMDPDSTWGAFRNFDPEVTAVGSEWVRWKPSNVQHIRLQMMDEARFISRDDWEKVREFVRAPDRPPLVGELLAGAESLADNGHRRSALTEAVTALEVAVSEFSRQPRAELAFGSVYAERMDVASLKKQVEHLGLSATIRYLLPLLFTKEQVPQNTLKACQSAVARRQMVVHQGQRDVRENEIHVFLQAIRQLCSVLESYKQP